MQARQRYTRVHQEDAASASSRASRTSEATQARLRRQQRAEVISTKLHAAVWVGLAAAAIFYSRIWAEVTEGDLLDRCGGGGAAAGSPQPAGRAAGQHAALTRRGPRHRTWFNLALVFMGIFSMITAYLVVYLPYIANIHLEWNVYCPRVIPAATAVSLCAIIWCGAPAASARALGPGLGRLASPRPPPRAPSLLVAFWPVYGMLTPLLLAVLGMGGLMSFHFVPAL